VNKVNVYFILPLNFFNKVAFILWQGYIKMLICLKKILFFIDFYIFLKIKIALNYIFRLRLIVFMPYFNLLEINIFKIASKLKRFESNPIFFCKFIKLNFFEIQKLINN